MWGVGKVKDLGPDKTVKGDRGLSMRQHMTRD